MHAQHDNHVDQIRETSLDGRLGVGVALANSADWNDPPRNDGGHFARSRAERRWQTKAATNPNIMI